MVILDGVALHRARVAAAAVIFQAGVCLDDGAAHAVAFEAIVADACGSGGGLKIAGGVGVAARLAGGGGAARAKALIAVVSGQAVAI
ncbi:hypothetical protein EA187_08160 [Lujinxingia sediminis]|uniref:Uncharacterized protein n=1 Tax=Lujinxingia sediminis TaxID=2480984 RepID=A0ABY0CUC3_9DELT|nr:hypothetical protein EA187_08160 [Lujinxingia sediminis]